MKQCATNLAIEKVTILKEGLFTRNEEERKTYHDVHTGIYQAALKTVAATEALIAKEDDVHERAKKKIASFKDIIFSLKERTASLGEQSGTGATVSESLLDQKCMRPTMQSAAHTISFESIRLANSLIVKENLRFTKMHQIYE